VPSEPGAPQLSLVIPVRDEEQNVGPLHLELTEVLGAIGLSYELILVDDGSVDETFARLVAIQAGDPRMRVIKFSRNFGQTAAFAAGFAHARGALIATSDGDLQNDPADLPALMTLAATHDIVCGWRRNRQDDVITRHLPSVAANVLIAAVTGIKLHDNGCSLKVFRAPVVKPLFLRPGMHRYLPAIASQLGGRVTEVVVHHRARQFGQSKYGLSRTFKVMADLPRLHRLMREALEPPPAGEPLYEVSERLH